MPSPTPSSGADPPAERWTHYWCLRPLPYSRTTPHRLSPHMRPGVGPSTWSSALLGLGAFHQLQCGTVLKPVPWEVLGSEASQLISQAETFLHVRQKGIQSKATRLFCGGFPALSRHNGHMTLCKFKVRNVMIWYTVRIYKWKLPRKNEIAVYS